MYQEKTPLTGNKNQTPHDNNNSIRSQSNGHNDPNIQLSVFTSKLDQIAKLLEATKKMTKILKSHANITKHNITVLAFTIPVQTSTTQLIQTNTNANLTTQGIKLIKLLAPTVQIVTLTLHKTQNDYHKLTKLLR